MTQKALHALYDQGLMMPFSGLGHDLGPAVRAAMRFVRRTRADKRHGHPWRQLQVRAVAGYDLMLLLGREVRGC